MTLTVTFSGPEPLGGQSGRSTPTPIPTLLGAVAASSANDAVAVCGDAPRSSLAARAEPGADLDADAEAAVVEREAWRRRRSRGSRSGRCSTARSGRAGRPASLPA